MKNAYWFGLLSGVVVLILTIFLPHKVGSYGNEILYKNYFLAATPVAFSFAFIYVSGWWKWVIFSFWIIQLPNSFYLMTDIYHLIKGVTINTEVWSEVLTLDFAQAKHLTVWSAIKFFMFGLSGWVLGCASITQILSSRELQNNKFKPQIFFVICVLSSIGVILGRTVRKHSLEIFSEPVIIAKGFVSIFKNPIQFVIFVGLVIIIYSTVKKTKE